MQHSFINLLTVLACGACAVATCNAIMLFATSESHIARRAWLTCAACFALATLATALTAITAQQVNTQHIERLPIVPAFFIAPWCSRFAIGFFNVMHASGSVHAQVASCNKGNRQALRPRGRIFQPDTRRRRRRRFHEFLDAERRRKRRRRRHYDCLSSLTKRACPRFRRRR